MNENEIKKANRKAMPKFILIMFISLIVGGGVGFFSAKYNVDTLADGIKNAGALFGIWVAPWLMLVAAVIMPVVCVPIYRNTKRLLSTWDGEDEEVSDTVDKKISIMIWITNAALIFSYFFIAASSPGSFAAFDNKENLLLFSIGTAAFIGIMIEAVIIQQKCVDTAKITNPEKTASIYDMKFQKKWMDSCDEAEKIVVGKCAFKAYAATNAVCTVLAVVFAIFALIFGIGFLPSLAICVIWFVNQSVYCREAIKYSKAGNKIS